MLTQYYWDVFMEYKKDNFSAKSLRIIITMLKVEIYPIKNING